MPRIPTILFLTGLLALSAAARQDTVLPFRVVLGGQEAALPEEHAPFAVLPTAVSPDAELVAEAGDESLVVNIFAADEKGNALADAEPVVIVVQKGKPATLAQAVDGRKLSPGRYVMNVVSPTKGTSRVFFAVR